VYVVDMAASTLCKKLCDLFFGETIFFTSLTDGNDNRLKYYISNATRLAKQVN